MKVSCQLQLSPRFQHKPISSIARRPCETSDPETRSLCLLDQRKLLVEKEPEHFSSMLSNLLVGLLAQCRLVELVSLSVHRAGLEVLAPIESIVKFCLRYTCGSCCVHSDRHPDGVLALLVLRPALRERQWRFQPCFAFATAWLASASGRQFQSQMRGIQLESTLTHLSVLRLLVEVYPLPRPASARIVLRCHE